MNHPPAAAGAAPASPTPGSGAATPVTASDASAPARAVIVTGSAQRLGREIALGMACAGWDVVVHYNRSADAAQNTVTDIRKLGRRAIALRCELSDSDQVAEFFAQATSQLPVCALVNNASHFEHDAPAGFSPAMLSAHIGPNLNAPLQLTRCLFEHLSTQISESTRGTSSQPHRGVAINLLDQKLQNLNPDFFSYTLTKQALLGATQMMAMAFAPVLRVVGVSPGLTLPSYLQDEQTFAAAHRQTALLDHSSRPQDIVAAVVFLASQPAITGINLTVDGGQHLMGLPRDVSYLDVGSDDGPPGGST